MRKTSVLICIVAIAASSRAFGAESEEPARPPVAPEAQPAAPEQAPKSAQSAQVPAATQPVQAQKAATATTEPGNLPIPFLQGTGVEVSLHGYFRAPLRLAVQKREGVAGPDDKGSYDFRLPRLVDGDYYKSNFAYTSLAESDWSELYLSVGYKNYSATIGLMATSLTDAAFSPDTPSPAGQKGISQAYATLKFAPAIAGQEIRLQLKAGAFWEQFGYQPRYDTYLFARTHLTGEQLSVETTVSDFTFSIMQGFGVHFADSGSEGLAVGQYYRVAASWLKRVTLGLNYLDAFSQDKVRNVGADSDMNVKGFDLTTRFDLFGDLSLGFSWVEIATPNSLAAAFEVMHTFKGQSLQSAYLGPNAKKGGLFNIGFSYDYHVDRLLRQFSAWPLPEQSQLTLSFFLLSMKTSSDVAAPALADRSIWTGFDGRQYLKLGGEILFRPVSWIGIAVRLDKVSMDMADPRSAFLAVSPRLVVFPGFGVDTQIFFQYTRYGYGSNVVLQPQDATRYGDYVDQNVFKVQAQSRF